MPEFTFSRPDKLTDSDIVIYEVYMLRFAARELLNRKVEMEAWVYLESFLLHFRNLIYFLGLEKGERKFRNTDICVKRVWQDQRLPKDALESLHRIGHELIHEYEPSDKRGGGRISEYLAHCTTTRLVPREWGIHEMYRKIEPSLTELEKHLKTSAEFGYFMKRVPPVDFREPLNASAMVYTQTASAAIALENLENPAMEPPFEQKE
jgi:hypothetical protein